MLPGDWSPVRFGHLDRNMKLIQVTLRPLHLHGLSSPPTQFLERDFTNEIIARLPSRAGRATRRSSQSRR